METADHAEAKQKLTDWFILNHSVKGKQPLIKAVIARYWNEHGQFAVSASAMKTQKNDWLEFFGDDTVDEATAYDRQEAFKTSLLKRMRASSVNKTLALGRAALRLSWRKKEIPAVPPITMLSVGDQEPMGYPLNPEQAAKLIRESSGHLWLFNVLALGTVGRPGAVLDLDKSQVDLSLGLSTSTLLEGPRIKSDDQS